MTRIEKESIIKVLQEHLNNVTSLEYGNYAQADVLSLNTKILYSRYFQKNEFDLFDFDPVSFRTFDSRENVIRYAWEKAHSRILTVSNAMLYEFQLPSANYKENEDKADSSEVIKWNKKKMRRSLLFFIASSVLLWSFNALVKWHWLEKHPKQIAIYLSFQFALFFISLLFFTDNRKIRSLEWFGALVSVAVSIASMIVSAVA